MIFSKEDKFILVKLYKSYLVDFDIYDKGKIISLFENIFVKIKKKYKLSGLFDVNIYVNDNYGMIIEIKNVYFYKDECDIKIKIHLDSTFLCEILGNEFNEYKNIYYYKDKFYGMYKEYCDKDVIYKDVDKIIFDGIKIC